MKKVFYILCVCICCLLVGCVAEPKEPVLSGSMSTENVSGLFSEEKGEFYRLTWNADESSVEKTLGISLEDCARQESSTTLDYCCSAIVLGYEGELTLSFQDENGLVRVAFFIPEEKEDYDAVCKVLKETFGEPNRTIENEDKEQGCAWARSAGASMTLTEANGGGTVIIIRNEKYFSLT